MVKQRIIVTGGTGKAGRWIVEHLVERGYDGVNVDTRPPLIIAADDTSSNVPSRELVRRFLPNVTDFRSELFDRTALISNRRAKQLLGWKQEHYLR